MDLTAVSTHSKCPATKTGAVSSRKGSKLFTACATDLSTEKTGHRNGSATREKSRKIAENHQKLWKKLEKNHRKKLVVKITSIFGLCQSVSICVMFWKTVGQKSSTPPGWCCGAHLAAWATWWSHHSSPGATRKETDVHPMYIPCFPCLSAQIMVFTSLVSISDVYLMCIWCVSDVCCMCLMLSSRIERCLEWQLQLGLGADFRGLPRTITAITATGQKVVHETSQGPITI